MVQWRRWHKKLPVDDEYDDDGGEYNDDGDEYDDEDGSDTSETHSI